MRTKNTMDELTTKNSLRHPAVVWRFCAYKSENDYELGCHYFEKYFTDHTKMKIFSAEHSASEKSIFPNYVSMYWRIPHKISGNRKLN